jgi:hypothetical protein
LKNIMRFATLTLSYYFLLNDAPLQSMTPMYV